MIITKKIIHQEIRIYPEGLTDIKWKDLVVIRARNKRQFYRILKQVNTETKKRHIIFPPDLGHKWFQENNK